VGIAQVISATRAVLGQGGQTVKLSSGDLQLAGQHAVLPLVATNTTQPAILDAAKVNGVQNLQKVQQLCALSAALSDAGIAHLAIKGPCLALQGYGNLALRQFTDLDLLIDWQDLPAADALIRARGGVSQEHLAHLVNATSVSPRAIGLTYLGEGVVAIDLHTGLSHRLGFVLNQHELFERATTVHFGERRVPTLSRTDATIFAALHGVQHGWGRLGWVVDAGKLLTHPDLNVEELVARSGAQGTLTIVGLAAALARDTLGFVLPDLLGGLADTSKVQRRLADANALLMAEGEVVNKGAMGLLRLQLGCWDRPLQVLEHTTRTLFTPTEPDYATIVFPGWLFWLYPGVRLLRLKVAAVRNVLKALYD
jgi:hypothetical protein